MNFDLTDEQTMLQDIGARYLAEHHDFEARRRIAGEPEGFSRSLWTALATELGIFGASFAEDVGGIGGDAFNATLIARELGRALVTSPYIPTIVMAGGILARSEGHGLDILRSIIAGTSIIAYCDGAQGTILGETTDTGFVLSGTANLVIGGPWANWLMVNARDGTGDLQICLVQAEAPGIERIDFTTIDGGRASDFRFSKTPVAENGLILSGAAAAGAAEAAADEAAVALSAEACGLLQRMLDDSLAYARQREQFGRPISAFQVIQHRLVEMFVEVEQAQAATMLASFSLNTPDRSKAAAAAKVQVAQACRKVGQAAIQIHGGIGMTDELALGHYFRRATMIESLLGPIDANLRNFAQINRSVVQTEDVA